MTDDILELIKYYSSGAPDAILLRSANDMLGRSSPEVRKKAISWIIENIPAHDGKYSRKLSVTDIRRALSEIGTDVQLYITEWTCDNCQLVFSYSQVVEYDDKHDRGIHDMCPRCGLQPCETIRATMEAERSRGKMPKWYGEWVATVDKGWRDGNAIRKPCGWIFDKKKDDDYVSDERRKEIEEMKKEAGIEVRKLTSVKSVV